MTSLIAAAARGRIPVRLEKLTGFLGTALSEAGAATQADFSTGSELTSFRKRALTATRSCLPRKSPYGDAVVPSEREPLRRRGRAFRGRSGLRRRLVTAAALDREEAGEAENEEVERTKHRKRGEATVEAQ